jgi:hypothetical protein
VVASIDPSCGARRLPKLEYVSGWSPRAPLSDERVRGVAGMGCFVKERATHGSIHAHSRLQPAGAAPAYFRRRGELGAAGAGGWVAEWLKEGEEWWGWTCWWLNSSLHTCLADMS